MTAELLAPPAAPCPAQVDCRKVLRAGYLAAYGVEVTVSLVAPLVWSPLGVWVCEHGTHYWPAPTAAQTAVWALDGGPS